MSIVAKLGLKWPIFQAPMAGVSTPAMAAAVSNAGGLGALGLGAAGVDGAREMLRAAKALTDRPINANVFCHAPARRDAAKEAMWLEQLAPLFAEFGAEAPAELSEIYRSFLQDQPMFDMLIEERPGVVSLHFGLPEKSWISALQDAGNLVFATATSRLEALACVDAGVDAIVAQGIEAGGHRGMFDPEAVDAELSTLDLVQILKAEIEVPVVAAGGLMTGKDIALALRVGAEAAQLGTAFIDTNESAADPAYRAGLRDPKLLPSVLTRAISGRPARCLGNRFVAEARQIGEENAPDYPVAYDAGKSLHAAAKSKGNSGFGAQWAGSGADQTREGGAAEILLQLGLELFTSQSQ
ncbi:MAG: NAD(P)H-dependent flavin oxidoreductase [Shimia sp.]|uniref:NAD(P)H-dependent flavin oxidoreductase n=1 Tax=Shimia sp. TaxID=1954381 RepID=UPI004058E87A